MTLTRYRNKAHIVYAAKCDRSFARDPNDIDMRHRREYGFVLFEVRDTSGAWHVVDRNDWIVKKPLYPGYIVMSDLAFCHQYEFDE